MVDRDLKAERGGRRPVKKSGPGIVVPVLIVVVLGGAGAIAMLGGNKAKKAPEAAPVAAKDKPFADLPREEPPAPRRAGSSSEALADAPEGLAADADWQKALAIAATGEALYDEAVAAKSQGETTLANEKGNAAKDKLNEAIEMSALWEDDIVAKYGDTDPQVRAVMRTRSGWFKKLDWLLKSTSR
jgi:hypothetical protein